MFFYIVGFVLMFVSLFLYFPFNTNDEETHYSLVMNLFYMILFRPVFVFGLILILYPMIHSRGGVLRAILELPFFDGISKLNFALFLVHPFLITYLLNGREKVFAFSIRECVMVAIGVITIGYAVGFIYMVAVEAPAKKIEKFIIFSFSKKKESQKDGDKTVNT